MLFNNVPTPEEIRERRQSVKWTQERAARELHTSIRSYQQWELGERHMHIAFWELFFIKTAEVPA